MIDSDFLHFQEFNITSPDFNLKHFTLCMEKEVSNSQQLQGKKKTISGFYIEKAKQYG